MSLNNGQLDEELADIVRNEEPSDDLADFRSPLEQKMKPESMRKKEESPRSYRATNTLRSKQLHRS